MFNSYTMKKTKARYLHGLLFKAKRGHSHSIVAGGLLDTS